MADDTGSRLFTAGKGAAPAVVGGAVGGPIGAAVTGIAADQLLDSRKAPYAAGTAGVVGAMLLAGGSGNPFGASNATQRRGYK